MRILLITGKFDVRGGSSSKLGETINSYLSNLDTLNIVDFFNGGTIDNLNEIVKTEVPDTNLIIWNAEVENDFEWFSKMKFFSTNSVKIICISRPEQVPDLLSDLSDLISDPNKEHRWRTLCEIS